MQQRFFLGVCKNRIKQQSFVIKEICFVTVDKAVTKIIHLYQRRDLIPVKCSLVAAQKKFKRDEVLLCS
jgi:hypothetical protein